MQAGELIRPSPICIKVMIGLQILYVFSAAISKLLCYLHSLAPPHSKIGFSVVIVRSVDIGFSNVILLFANAERIIGVGHAYSVDGRRTERVQQLIAVNAGAILGKWPGGARSA